MPFYYIYEIRSADETIVTNKQLTTDLSELVKLDQKTVDAGRVKCVELLKKKTAKP